MAGSPLTVLDNAQALGCYPEAIALLDQEFVFGKGRSISLAKRMPAAYSPENSANIYCGVSRHTVVGVAAARRFETWVGDQWVTGCMIGGMVTQEKYRRQGIASQLLSYLESKLVDPGFLILWTGIPEFYRRLGWQDGSRGVFGRLCPRDRGGKLSVRGIVPETPEMGDLEKVDRLRERSKLALLRESNRNRYSNIPLPAEKVEVLKVMGEQRELEAYAAVGSRGDTVYIYELVGEDAARQDILGYLDRRYATVFFNAEDLSGEIFTNVGAFDVKPGPNTLLKCLSPRITLGDLRGLYISHLDRI